MKIYTETRGVKQFDWYTFLKKETYTIEECNHSRTITNDWVKQAVTMPPNNRLPFLILLFDRSIIRLHELILSGLDFKDLQVTTLTILAEIEELSS